MIKAKKYRAMQDEALEILKKTINTPEAMRRNAMIESEALNEENMARIKSANEKLIKKWRNDKVHE